MQPSPWQLVWRLGEEANVASFPDWCCRSSSSSWKAGGRKSSRCRPSSRPSASRDASWGGSGCEGLLPAASPPYQSIRPARVPACCRIPWAVTVPCMTFRCAHKHCRACWQQAFPLCPSSTLNICCCHQIFDAGVTPYFSCLCTSHALSRALNSAAFTPHDGSRSVIIAVPGI